MAQRTFAFNPPRWRPQGWTNLRTGGLILASLAWLALYGWLGRRLFARGIGRVDQLTWLLITAAILLGVGVVVGWWRLQPRLQARLLDLVDRSRGRALSLAKLQDLSPSGFEEYVAQRVFARQGYRVENTPDTKDGGIDIRVRDRSGALAVVQCKRYNGTVGSPTVRDLFGTMNHIGATHGYLVTTGRISNDARIWAQGKPISLIDGRRLVALARAEADFDPIHME